MQEETGKVLEGEDTSLEQQQRDALDNLGFALAATRSKAIEDREQSGIEAEWAEDEEFYEGIDDANRGEQRAWSTKPPGQSAPKAASTSSTVFANITRPYCDAAAAKVGDMLMPTDDRGWSIKPTPVPETADIATGKFSPTLRKQIQSYYQNQGGAPAAEQKMAELTAMAVQEAEEAKDKAKKAQTRIEDWHVEGQFHSVMREVIEDATRIGSGVIKGPVPEMSEQAVFLDGQLQKQAELKPVSKHIDPWNFYPDGGCGQNIHDGAFTWERDDISGKTLAKLAGADGYVESQVRLVLSEGPMRVTKVAPSRDNNNANLVPRDTDNQYEIWYYNGQLTKADVDSSGLDLTGEGIETTEPGQSDAPGEYGHEVVTYDAQVTMVNNHVIKATMNPLESGDFPYDVMVWQRRKGIPWGRGVSRQIRTPQRIVIGAIRNMMDNAGRAGGPQVMVQRGIVEPADGKWEIRPWKFWIAIEGADTESIDKAFRFVKIDMLQAELEAIVRLGMKLAEDVTGLPMLLQGQSGPGTPDTFGGMKLVNNNASTVLRRIARLFDDQITEPHIRRYHQYLLQYGDDSEKGDLVVDARGSSALVEREIESETITGLVQLSVNPVFGLDPKKTMEEWLRSKKLAPKNFQFDDDQWEKIMQTMSQKPQDQRMAVAEIKDKTERFLAEMNKRLKLSELQMDRDSDEKDRQLKILEMQLNTEDADAKRRGEAGISLDRAKTILTKTMMELRTQKELSGTEAATPPVEPKGRAEDGKSYTQ